MRSSPSGTMCDHAGDSLDQRVMRQQMMEVRTDPSQLRVTVRHVLVAAIEGHAVTPTLPQIRLIYSTGPTISSYLNTLKRASRT